MKKISYLFVLSVIMLVSCERNEVAKSDDYAVIESIKSKAKELSNKHDSLVIEMLKLEKCKRYQKAKSTSNQEAKLNLNEMLDVIKEVTGVTPVLLNTDDPDDTELNKVKSNITGSTPVINLDSEFVSMSDYANSDLSKKYLECVDQLLQHSEFKSYEHIVSEITAVQNEILADANASNEDIQLVMNATEVLKGSLKIWENVLPTDYNQVRGSRFLVSSALKWPRWLKWVFIGAADAVGGSIAWFSGATITIMNVPIYLPPGPVGAAGGAAAVSVLATIIAFQ
jgi:hypothetical protein